MNHKIFGRKLSRTKNERRRLLQGLARELVIHGSIQTTLAKAKAVQPLIEKLVTKAKNGKSPDVAVIRAVLAEKQSVDRLLSDAKTRFSGRSSGYTRIIKLGIRRADFAQMVLFSFVDQPVNAEVIAPLTREKQKTPLRKEKKTGKKPDTRKTKSAVKNNKKK